MGKYKPGYSPEELTRDPIEGTCLQCGDKLLIYPAGAVCEWCSPAWQKAYYERLLEEYRRAQGFPVRSRA